MPRFAGRQLTEVKLYPITLGYQQPRTRRGWPMLAPPDLARKIIDDVTKFSTALGTRVEFKDGAGVIAVTRTNERSPAR